VQDVIIALDISAVLFT